MYIYTGVNPDGCICVDVYLYIYGIMESLKKDSVVEFYGQVLGVDPHLFIGKGKSLGSPCQKVFVFPARPFILKG